MTITEDGAPPATETRDPVADDTPGRGAGAWRWIAVVAAVALFAGVVGWRVGRTQSEPDVPARSSVDVGFFQDMQTHHNQAVAMGLIYLEYGTDPLLRQIASEIVTYQSAEIGIMGEYLHTWGQAGTETNISMAWMGAPTPRDQMYGLATKAQMKRLADARGTDLDQLFTRLMIVHHAGGIYMASFANNLAHTEVVKRWAAGMEDGQRGEIAEMNRWRVNHGMAAVDSTVKCITNAAGACPSPGG